MQPYALLSWRQWVLLGGAILLLSWLYMQTTAVDPEKHLHFISTIRTIKQLDANLNQDVLRARYNLLVHYDPFVDTLDQLRAHERSLATESNSLYLSELDPTLQSAMQVLYTATDSKARQIENFKSHNAILKNSLHYFPVASEQLLERCDQAGATALCHELRRLQRDTLVFNLVGDPELESDIHHRMARIRGLLPSSRLPLAEATATVLSHSENILRAKREVDALTAKILSAELPRAADRMSQLYDSAHGQAMRRSGTYRSLLYALALMLLGYAVYSVARIKFGALALEKANRQLMNQVDERQRAQDKLSVYQEMINGANDAIALLDPQLRFEELNAAHCRLTDCGDECSLRGHSLQTLLSLDDAQRVTQGIEENGHFRGELVYRLGNGRTVNVEMSLFALQGENGAHHYVTILRDVSERQAHLAALEFQSTHDALTGLANRVRLYAIVEQAEYVTTAGHNCLMLLDLDRFKEINDTLGHHAGDMVLSEVGHRIDSVIQDTGLIARMGGDEFAVWIPRLGHSGQALQIASRILSALRPPIKLDGLAVEISGSIGIALSPEHGTTPSQLMRCADVAMYQAKNNSMGFSIYDPDLDQHSTRRLSIMTGLGQAIEQDQLLLHFQPKLSLTTGNVTGFEALVRWRHPEHGMIPPDQFIPLAEMSDLIGPLTLRVVDKALAQAREWKDAGLNAAVAVNFSARNFLDDSLPHKLAELLDKYDLPHDCLEVEITESTMMADPTRSLVIMNRIHEMGLLMSIDDYGTGHSSLAYLQRMPIHSLKIDLSFVRDMMVKKENEVIVHSTIQLAHNLGLNVIAEGVEDEPTLTQLRDFGCNEAQGYFISRPMEAEQATIWLMARQRA